jgi:hypothetical protein
MKPRIPTRISLSLNPGFCNGPWFVNPSFYLRHPFAGVLLLSGVSAMGCHLMGFEEDRSANLE